MSQKCDFIIVSNHQSIFSYFVTPFGLKPTEDLRRWYGSQKSLIQATRIRQCIGHCQILFNKANRNQIYLIHLFDKCVIFFIRILCSTVLEGNSAVISNFLFLFYPKPMLFTISFDIVIPIIAKKNLTLMSMPLLYSVIGLITSRLIPGKQLWQMSPKCL